MKKAKFLSCVLILFIQIAGFSQNSPTSNGAVGKDKLASSPLTPEQNLEKLGIIVPTAPSPAANYVNGVRTGNLLFLAGKGPSRPDGTLMKGKLG